MPFFLNLGNLVVHLTADTTRYERAMKRTEARMMATSRKMTGLGKKMMLSVTAPLALIGTMAVRSFAKFDDAMTKSLAIMGNVSGDMRREMEMTARALSTEGVTSAEDLAKSYFFLASAGLSAKQSIAALPVVQKFAVAGAFDMAQATDLLTDAQSALGLTVKDTQQNMLNMTKVSDVLVKANTLANASVEQFSKSLTTRAAASLRNLNKDLEEGVSILAAFADQGIKGEEAGTRLSIVLRDLQTANIKNKAVWDTLNLSVFDSNGMMRNISDIIGDLEKQFGGMNDEQKKSTALLLGFKDKSFSAIESLLGLSKRIAEYERQLRKAQGVTDEVARKQLESFASQMKIVWNQVVDVANAIGKDLAPIILKMGKEVKDATKWWKGLDDSTRKTVLAFAIILGMLGPMLFLMGKMVAMFSAFVSVIRLTTVALHFMRVQMAKSALASKTLAAAMVGIAAFSLGDWLNDEFIWVRNVMSNAITAWMKVWAVMKKAPELAAKGIVAAWHTAVAAVGDITLALIKVLTGPQKFLGQILDKLGVTTGQLQSAAKALENSLKAGIDAHKDAAIAAIDALQPIGEELKEQHAEIDRIEKLKRKQDKAEIARLKRIQKTRQAATKNLKKEVDELQKFDEMQKKEILSHEERAKKLLAEADAVGRLKVITEEYNDKLAEAEQTSKDFANAFGRAIEDMIMDVNDFRGILKALASDLTRLVVRSLVIKPLADAISSGIFTAIKPSAPTAAPKPVDLSSVITNLDAMGNAYTHGNRITAFASGGVVGSSTAFPLANGRLGVMGEKGPEGILPLERGPDGKLGVKSVGGDRPVIVNFHGIKDMNDFRRSESQIVSTIGRAVRR